MQDIETTVYKRRWVILMIFVLYSASNAMQWIQYSIIANIIMVYYDVSSFSVDMTSMIYMITYIPFIFPASYLLDRFVSATTKVVFDQLRPFYLKNRLEKLIFLNRVYLCMHRVYRSRNISNQLI